jgi:hypothetical protein
MRCRLAFEPSPESGDDGATFVRSLRRSAFGRQGEKPADTAKKPAVRPVRISSA